jgi:L-asparaginase
MLKKVVFLGMGGTIAGKAPSAEDNVGYKAGQVPVQDLLLAVPGLQAVLGDRQLLSEQVCQIDSKDLAHSDWARLHGRIVHYLSLPEVQAVLVTHGTDTLEETAYFLSQTLPAQLLALKPVVMTCAMRPASSLTPDGPANMAEATAVALSARACGVLVACAGKVHAAAHVQKVHPYRVDAFDSGEAGPVGVVEEGVLRLLQAWPAVVPTPHAGLTMEKLEQRGWPRVELLWSHAGAGGALVRCLLAAPELPEPVRGIVVAGTGNATVHRDMELALQEAVALGVRVVRVSRCAYGQVVGGPETGSGGLAALGLSAVKARIALMLELAANL